jgi:pyridoxal phosphate enzyme (YggS family)
MNNLEIVLEKIEKARLAVNEHTIVKLVAVSKYSDAKAIETLYRQGQRAFGENRVQELKSKMETLDKFPLEWHFQGVLQKNKINQLLSLSPSLIHSVDSLELAIEIDKRATTKTNVLLQINSADEPTKSGVALEAAYDIYQQIAQSCPNLTLKGVMSIGAHSDDVKIIQKSFEDTYAIYEQLKPYGAKICSMGMSGDFELAIACGSNMLRLGSVLFK